MKDDNIINLSQETVYRIEKKEVGEKYKVGDRVSIPELRNTTNYTGSKNNLEELFEAVRQKDFSYLPSRLAARFVLPYNLNIVSKWVNEHFSHRKELVCLLSLRLTGKIVWCDENNFNAAILQPKISNKEQLALKYWNTAGAINGGFILPEGLFFEGEAVITDIKWIDTDQFIWKE